jgi:hypothetical protein
MDRMGGGGETNLERLYLRSHRYPNEGKDYAVFLG